MFDFDTILYGLTLACPLNSSNKYCPLDKIRKMPIKEQLYYIENLSKAEKRDLLTRHNKCIEGSEEKFLYDTAN